MQFAPLFLTAAVALTLTAGCAESPPPVPAAPAAAAPSAPAAADTFPVLASPAEQARMQKYADDLYDRRYVRSTFQSGGADFDCVDFDKQPACKNGGCPSAPPAPPTPPPPPAPLGGAPAPGTATAVGGGATCPAGTVPVRRPDLRIMRRFHTLEEYLGGFKVAPPH
jgi:hypothetical protein